MAHEFKLTRTVEFADTDMAGIAHFSAFFRYMEQTEHAFYRSLGFSVHEHLGEEIRGFPRVAASCDFSAPLRFEDEVEIHLLVKEKRVKSIEYVFIFNKLNGNAPREVARGRLVVVYASKNQLDLKIQGLALPPQIADKIDAAPPELYEVEGP